LLHLRARWYDGSSGIFLSKDPWPGNELSSQSINGWNYVGGNPVNRVDPTGKHPICIAALATGGTIIILDGACLTALAIVGGTSAVLWYTQQDINLPGGGPTRPDYAPDQPAPAPAPAPPQVYPDVQTGTGENPLSLPAIYQAPRPQQTPIPYPIPYNPRLPLPTETCTETPRPNWYLYHYTFAERIPSIIATGLRPSIGDPGNPSTDAQWGDGQYFTDLTPEDASMATRYQVAKALFNIPWKWGRPPNLRNIGWIKVDVSNLPVRWVAEVFSPERFPGRSIYLHDSTVPLPITDKIRGRGVVTFQPSPSGYR
jgi:hypothetical protein